MTNSRSRLFFSSTAKREVAEEPRPRPARSSSGLLMVGLDAPSGRWEPYEAAVGGLAGDPVPDESLGAAMLYSSGTTGQPKGILRPLPESAPREALPVMAVRRASCSGSARA